MSGASGRYRIEPVTEADIDALLPLMRRYCEFYEAAPGSGPLIAMARALIADPQHLGLQLLARDEAGAAAGFATLFWTWDTLIAAEIAVMNDLYVVPANRGSGLGRALIGACAERCRARKVKRMDWQTAPENARAQRLYDSLEGEREDAVVYSLTLAPG